MAQANVQRLTPIPNHMRFAVGLCEHRGSCARTKPAFQLDPPYRASRCQT